MTPLKPVELVPVVREWSMDYTMVHEVVPLVRIHIRRQLLAWGWAGDEHNVGVMASELVTNAVNHGRRVGHTLNVRLALLEDGGLVVDVSDPVPALPRFQERLHAGGQDECGRGLHVIRSLGGALSWFLRDDDGKTVRVHITV
ncbi:ATP-binding protein [Streptomyces sp. NPDC102360]|uniref:ATP-binding protein n=1 Tax=Streptomyces sp. NPDC102360 TaxID=3366160 RepID=UPI0037FCA21B